MAENTHFDQISKFYEDIILKYVNSVQQKNFNSYLIRCLDSFQKFNTSTLKELISKDTHRIKKLVAFNLISKILFRLSHKYIARIVQKKPKQVFSFVISIEEYSKYLDETKSYVDNEYYIFKTKNDSYVLYLINGEIDGYITLNEGSENEIKITDLKQLRNKIALPQGKIFVLFDFAHEFKGDYYYKDKYNELIVPSSLYEQPLYVIYKDMVLNKDGSIRINMAGNVQLDFLSCLYNVFKPSQICLSIWKKYYKDEKEWKNILYKYNDLLAICKVVEDED